MAAPGNTSLEKEISHQELTWQASFSLHWDAVPGAQAWEARKSLPDPYCNIKAPSGFLLSGTLLLFFMVTLQGEAQVRDTWHCEWLFKRPVIVPAAKNHPEIGPIWTLYYFSGWLWVKTHHCFLILLDTHDIIVKWLGSCHERNIYPPSKGRIKHLGLCSIIEWVCRVFDTGEVGQLPCPWYFLTFFHCCCEILLLLWRTEDRILIWD